MTAIIIDDERHAREGLAALLRMYCPHLVILGEAGDMDTGIHLIRKHPPDMVFLDIAIGEHSGFQLLDQLPEVSFQLVFTTAYSEFAIKAFRYHAIDYLLKPIQPQLLMAAVEKARDSLQTRDLQLQLDALRQFFGSGRQEKIVISTMEGLSFIRIHTIVHVVGSGNYSTFHLENGEKILASKNLKHYEDLLPSDRFFRSHQSHLVNIRYITKIRSQEGHLIELEGGFSAPLVQKRKEALLALLKGIR